jgi:hypothetical protein
VPGGAGPWAKGAALPLGGQCISHSLQADGSMVGLVVRWCVASQGEPGLCLFKRPGVHSMLNNMLLQVQAG